jgi:transcriptional regulator with XRE-family HTH domain
MRDGVKKIREALGLNQVQFGQRIGRSLGAVRQYEAGARISPPARKAIQELAESAGLGDLVDDFLAEREQVEPAPGLPIVGRPSVKTIAVHDLLSEILASGNGEAIRAVTANLRAFARYVRAGK